MRKVPPCALTSCGPRAAAAAVALAYLRKLLRVMLRPNGSNLRTGLICSSHPFRSDCCESARGPHIGKLRRPPRGEPVAAKVREYSRDRCDPPGPGRLDHK